MTPKCEGRPISPESTRTILFVCTGNTCRSPMAEAIARHKLGAGRSGEGGEGGVDVLSAGAFAGAGAPATPEAIRAADALGVALRGHASRPLTRELLARADIVFALARSHAEAITRIDPTAADRVYLLDPDGLDVPDPIGHPQAVYDETARTLDRLIGLRFEEFGVLADNAHRKDSS